ncbi:hypothetical protein BH11ARM1_BH11ARM1_11720 [soil metagenome]
MSSSTASELDRLIGLQSGKRLVARLAQGEIGAHAVLFYGVAGSGKNSLARILAQAWLCRTPNENGADGECRSCQSFLRGTNADFLLVQPSGASQIIVTRQIRPVDEPGEDVMPITEFLRTMPLGARNKVVLIEDAHRMNKSAANALLKTLEEPESYSKLILTTTAIGTVPPTILSRCLPVVCELPSSSELQAFAGEVSEDILAMSDGAPARVVAALAAPANYEMISAFARSLLTLKQGAALVASERFREISDGLAATEKLGVRAANSLALELLATIFARQSVFSARWTQESVEAHRKIVGNANAQLVFDSFFASLLARN